MEKRIRSKKEMGVSGTSVVHIFFKGVQRMKRIGVKLANELKEN